MNIDKCKNCNKILTTKQIKRNNNFCSVYCWNNYQSKQAKIKVLNNGYLAFVEKKKLIYYHRFIFELYTGIILTSNDIIHHKDHNKLNNNIHNLALYNNSKHAYNHIFNTFTNPLVEIIQNRIIDRRNNNEN